MRRTGINVFVGTAMCPSVRRKSSSTRPEFDCWSNYYADCFWCQEAYSLENGYSGNMDKRGCSSVGISIAPIPSSILSVEASYNKTYTGIISEAGPANTGSSGGYAAATATDSATKSESSTAQTTGSTAENIISLGVTNIVTLNGGGQGNPTAAPTSNPAMSPSTTIINAPKAGLSTGGAQRWNSGITVMSSFIAIVVSVLYLI